MATGTLFSFPHVSPVFPGKAMDLLLAAWQRALRTSAKVRLVIKTFPTQTDVAAQVDHLRAVIPSIFFREVADFRPMR